MRASFAWIAYGAGHNGLFYWRTRSGVEVDFVIYGAAGIVAVEVKNAAQVRAEDLRGLAAFGNDYPEAVRVLLYRGTLRERRDGVWIVPVAEFLSHLRPDAPLFQG